MQKQGISKGKEAHPMLTVLAIVVAAIAIVVVTVVGLVVFLTGRKGD